MHLLRETAGIDLVLEGEASRVTDGPTLEALAAKYRDGGWPVEVEGDAFTAPYSAPSAGPPPWDLYRFTIRTAFGVTTAEPFGATRWRFGDLTPHAEPSPMARLRRLRTPELTASEVSAIRDLLRAAFGPEEDEQFGEDDWQHALGGLHFVLDAGGVIVGHASVVDREIHVDGRPLRTGYVEAVGVDPDRQATGYGSQVMTDVNDWILERYELGALGTGRHRFYERLGWRTWAGPTFVRKPDGPQRTPDEDGYILVLETPSSPPIDLAAPISCEWRPGDVW